MKLTTLDYSPNISVIIPVYNGMKTLQLCLNAIFAQDYPRDLFEVILVDNNSTDGTPQFAQQYPIKLVYERDIQGPHAASNTGVLAATGEILVFIDSDCVPEPNWLRNLIAPFSDESIVATGGEIRAFKPTTSIERFLDTMKPFKNVFQVSSSFPAALITGNCAFRRKEFIATGLFNPNMYTGAEVDLSYRIQLGTGRRAVFAVDAIVNHIYTPTLKRLARHFYIYGYSEILLGTIYKDFPGYPWPPKVQLGIMLRQVGALGTYIGSMIFRTVKFPFQQKPRGDYLKWPFLWFIVEFSNLRGKIEGLVVTRFFRYKFWENKVRTI